MIGIGCDHGGYELKQEIIKLLQDNTMAFKDFGTYSKESVDYPDYAKAVSKAIVEGECDKGILICGTGVGISIAANRINGIRAALCSDCYTAQATREHNNANILVLGGRTVGVEVAKKIVKTFFATEFSNDERHIRRIDKIEE